MKDETLMSNKITKKLDELSHIEKEINHIKKMLDKITHNKNLGFPPTTDYQKTDELFVSYDNGSFGIFIPVETAIPFLENVKLDLEFRKVNVMKSMINIMTEELINLEKQK